MIKLTVKKVLLKLIALKIAGTCFAVFIYAKFTPLSDADTYVSGGEITSEKFTTVLLRLIGGHVASIFGEFGTHLLVSILLGLALYPIVSRLTGPRLSRAYLAIILPSFMVWTSIFSKETFAVIGSLLAFNYWFALLENKSSSLRTIIMAILGLLILGILRPPYAIGAIWILFITWIIDKRPYGNNASLWKKIISQLFMKGSLSKLSIGVFIFLGLIVFISFLPFFTSIFNQVIDVGIAYFKVASSKADRAWVQWGTRSDFWANLWWGFWFSIIGPLPSEVINRIEFLPFFIEGILIIYLVFSGLFRAMTSIQSLPLVEKRFFKKIVYLGVIPVLLWLALVHTAFGTINPGSASRYRTGFELFLTLVPLIVWQASITRKLSYSKITPTNYDIV